MGFGRYTYWRDLLEGKKSFGEKVARRIEAAVEDLPRGWLDQRADTPVSEEAAYDPARHIAENFEILRQRLLRGRGRIPSNKALAEEMGVGNGTVDRMRRGVGAYSLPTLQLVAAFFKLEAWQLLAPRLGQPTRPDERGPDYGKPPAMVAYKDRLVAAMKLAEVNERELAKILGISYQGVVKALKGGPTGESAMTAENNPKVARVLGVDPDWLATGEGAPTAEPPLRLTPTERAIVLAYRQAQRMPPTAGELPSHREPLARMKTIHDRIRELRQAKGWSLQRLAEEVTRLEGKKAPLVWQTVQQWEKSTRPKHERLAVVAQALGTTVPALMGC